MKLKVLTLLIVCFSAISFAQSKVGTVDSKYILSLMPEMKIVGERANEYSQKLDSSFNIKLKEFQEKVTDFKGKEKEMGTLEKKTYVDELTVLENDIKKYQDNGRKLVQLKQNELLRPLYKKLSDAITAISKEQKYTQVLTISGNEFAYIDEKFDITNLVIKRLGITIPETPENK
jgi:outer membrane protein